MKNKPYNTKFLRLFPILLFCILFNNLSASIVVINGLTHVHKVEEGQLVKGVIEIQNTHTEKRAVRVYQKDYLFSHKGEVYYNEPNSNPRSNANWIDFSPAYIELEAFQKTVINYEVTIPDGAELIGSFWSVLMIEGILPVENNNANTGVNISTIMRYAIQIVTNIGDSGVNNLDFVEAKLDRINGTKVSSIALENNGERLLSPEISIEIFNEEGESIKVVKADKKKIYPGTSALFHLDLDGVPKGKYEAIVLADCEEDAIFGLNLSLDLSDD